MYYLNKIVSWCVSPIEFHLIGLGAVAVCAVLKRRRLAWMLGFSWLDFSGAWVAGSCRI